MPNIVVQFTVAVAFTLLLAALMPIKQIHEMLESGPIRVTWSILAILIGLSGLGYVFFLHINMTEGPNHHEDWLISLVFLTAGIFVFTVCILSLGTARDVSRIASLEFRSKH